MELESNRDRHALTPREREVLLTIARGHDSKTTAAQLFVSTRTVEFHLSQAYRKLGAKNRVQAINIAVQQGLIPTIRQL